MKKKDYEQMMTLGRRLFKQENKKYNGIMRFTYLNNSDTGETIFFVPDKETADRVRKILDEEFTRLHFFGE